MGNDTINNYGDDVIINSGAGDDKIENGKYGSVYSPSGGSRVTINAGVGNDSISNKNFTSDVLIQYSNGDGDDVIEGFKGNVKLSISREFQRY